MKVTSVSNTPYNRIIFCAQKQNSPSFEKRSPIYQGANTAGAWFGFGVVFDFILRKCPQFFKSPVKNSLFINGVIGALAGTCTLVKTSLDNKKMQNNL